jgi:hypothetical protein
MHEQLTGDGDHVARFRREARLAAQLSHPNIVTVIDRGEQDQRQFIVFEYVEGENLKALIEREAPLPERAAVELALQVAGGLAFAHEHGLVHRDVKPQNVLLTEDGRAKVTDFGIARSLDVRRGLTQTGTVLGTSDYISPEQARGGPVDECSDIYSLGAVLYELLTGEVPFPGDNFVSVAMRHLNEPVPSIRAARPDVSPRLDAAVRRAMAKDPGDRFPSMEAFAAELRACLADPAGAGVGPAGETLVLPRAPRRFRRRQQAYRPPAERPSVWPLILLLAGLAILAGIFAAVFAFTGSPTKFGTFVHKVKKEAGAEPGGSVNLTAVGAYDPQGDGEEHDAEAASATDGNAATYWTTQQYASSQFGGLKDGVGLVLDSGKSQKLSEVTVTSSTAGFTAVIKASQSSTGPFAPVSSSQTVGSQTTFSLHGSAARYYLIWLTSLPSGGVARVNEVTGKD